MKNRSHRIVLFSIAGIWIISIFDLILTILAIRHGILLEMNPIARSIISIDYRMLIPYKVLLTSFGTYWFFKLRYRKMTLYSAIIVLLCYGYLAIHWHQEYFSISD